MRKPRRSPRSIGVGAVLGLLLFLVPVVASAQSVGGRVTDTTGGVLPGVTVEVRSPALIEQVRTAISDGAGQYLIIELVPGTYSVTFTLPGFSTFVRDGVELIGEATANINAEMQVGNVEETITVTGASPVVDVRSTRQQAVMTRDVMDSIPNGREFANLVLLVPGMKAGQIYNSVPQDVGGQSGQLQMALGIHGGDATDQEVQVDGMTQGSALSLNHTAHWLTDSNFEEYQIDYSANSAEIETGGVRVNMIPREGSNSFSSRIFGNFTTEGLQQNNLDDDVIAQGFSDPNRVKELWHFTPSVGGPIVRDKLWFFGAFTRRVTDAWVADTHYDTDVTDNVYIPDFSRQAVDDQRLYDAASRLTWQATQRNKISASLNYNHLCHCHILVGTAAIGLPIAPTAAGYQWIDSYIPQVTWVSPVTSRLLVEAGFGVLAQVNHWRNQPEVEFPNGQIGILEVGSGLRASGSVSAWNGSWATQRSRERTYTARASASYVTGSHAAKVGFTFSRQSQRAERRNSPAGDYSIRTLFGRPLFVGFNGNPIELNASYRNLGIYAQDQWTLDRLTVNAGVRFDYFRSGYPDHNIAPTPLVPVARVFPGDTAVSWTDLQPRLGVVYDLFGDGRTALKATVNRFGDRNALRHAGALNPAANNNTSGFRFWVDSNGDFFPDCDPLNPAPNGECVSPGNRDFGQAVINTFYDEDWATGWGNKLSNWEFSGSVQHEITPGMSLNVAYFRRIFTNFDVRHNRALSPADYDPYCVTVPIHSGLPGGGGNEVCDLFDLNPAKAGLVDRLRTSLDQFGKQIQRWNGVDVTVNARMANGFVLQGGWSTGKSTNDDCEVRAAAEGNPSQHHCSPEPPFITDVKLLGTYTLPGDVQVSATFQAIQGHPVLANVQFSSAQIAASLGRPPAQRSSTTVQVIEPGAEYGPRLYQTDFRLTKIFHWGPSRIQAMFDLYNLFNSNTVLFTNESFGADGMDWLKPASLLPGRLAKFGFQLDF